MNNILAVLGRMLRYAHEVEFIESVPRIKLLKVPPQEFDFLTFEELPRLLDAVKDDPERRTLLLLGSDAGLRQGELVALEWGDVNLVAGTLTVRRSSWHGIVGTPKSGRDRKVPLTARLRTALRAHRHLRSELVFCHADGSPLLSPQSRRRFGSPASGPGSGASAPMCFGTPSARTSPCVGRRRRRSRSRWTLRYMHLAPSALREAIGLLDLGHQVGNAQKASRERLRIICGEGGIRCRR
ncbi:MAG TPA: tyrosine-type recombinase/integrase [Polyangiaceae bacterium]|nr:tyrosine-type recombinase/integrase [Polyangiaceae bacterium]